MKQIIDWEEYCKAFDEFDQTDFDYFEYEKEISIGETN